MLQLRREGWSLLRLAYKYNKSHCTILYHCKKNGVEPQVKKKITYPYIRNIVISIERAPQPGDKYLDLIDEQCAPTKRYRDILAESLERETERKYEERFKDSQRMPKEWRAK